MSTASTDLGETMAAPLPDVTLDASFVLALGGGALGATASTLASPALSVLPRMEQVGDTLRLAATGGPRYAPVRILGKGGMGEVALVEDRDIGRSVAVKQLLPEATSPGGLARFVDEVRTIGRLEHPNIVPIHDVGVDDAGRFFFVMKYIDGETLESVIHRLRHGEPEALALYDVPRRVETFKGLLRALQFAHERGVLHRDIKPANVMVGRFGEVVLMDWGVATARRASSAEGTDRPPPGQPTAPATPEVAADRLSATQIGTLVGTPQYMSPEQTRGANASMTERSDLYSACVLFHELLGLRHRHEGQQTLLGLLMAVANTDPPAVHEILPPHPSQPEGVAAEYGHFLRRGLQRDPAHRWSSASEMLDELHDIQSGHCRVQCGVTLMKRSIGGLAHVIDRWPVQVFAGVVTLAALFVAMMVATALLFLG